MANKFNLEGIKEEMANRRSERNSVSEQLGEPIANQAKDGFLNGLITSFNTGRETHATKRIKLIENKVDIREGKVPKFKENREDMAALHEVSQNRTANRGVIPINTSMNPELRQAERDELMYTEMSKRALRGGQTLSESLMSVAGGNHNVGELPIASTQLNEGIKSVVNNYLAENFSLIVEESIKSTILEMYAVERIKEVLHENRGMIKGIMLEILKEMKTKQKV